MIYYKWKQSTRGRRGGHLLNPKVRLKRFALTVAFILAVLTQVTLTTYLDDDAPD